MHLQRKGKSKRTINRYRKDLIRLAKSTLTTEPFKGIHVDLKNPETVELAIAESKIIDWKTKKPTNRKTSNSHKAKMCTAYNHYCKFFKINWEKPIYTPEESSIQPPTAEQASILIAGMGRTLSLKVQISAETGLRPCEIQGENGLKVKDHHKDQQTITAISAKKCNARPPMKISEELNTRIATYITKNNLKPEDLLFTGQPERFSEHFRRSKIKLAKKLEQPELMKIRLYDLRHYYVTAKLKKIQNCEIVRQIVGHKRLNTTQRYMHLLANNNSGEWIIEQTQDRNRAAKLEASGFTYSFTTPDGWMQFKKPQ